MWEERFVSVCYNDSSVTGLVTMLLQSKKELLGHKTPAFRAGAKVACDIFLARLGQGHLVFFPPAKRSDKVCTSARDWDHCDFVCVYLVHVSVCIFAFKCKKNSGCGCQREKKRADWRVKMCVFDLVRACILWFWFVELYERLRLRVLDEMRKHHFLFAGWMYVWRAWMVCMCISFCEQMYVCVYVHSCRLYLKSAPEWPLPFHGYKFMWNQEAQNEQ